VADSAVPAEPVVADAAPAAGQQAEAVDTAPAPVEETQPTAPVAKKQPAADGGVKVVKTKKIKPPVDEAQAAAVPADAGPVGERPADQPVTIVGQTGGQNAGGEQQVASAADAATQAGAGGYAIQIASTPSPEAAKSTYAALTRKYGGVISGRGVSIQKADVDGKGTVYRVRIPAGSKQEAAALCARYKASGGSCFVTK
jgi:hypothetical protein